MAQIFKLTDQEVADLVRAMQDAQMELCCGPGFPEATAQWDRWLALIDRFTRGATADGDGERLDSSKEG